MMDSSGPILHATNLHKRYGATVALDDVAFALNRGEVCGLLGENGAGKSTLVKILSGIVVPDAGEIVLDGISYRPRNIAAAKARGLSTAFQELSLIPTLSVATNLFLPKPKINAFRLVSMRAIEEQADAILHQYGIIGISPSTLVSDLPLATRQRIEIVRAMLLMPSVLLLDEPTAALSDREWLFGLIDTLIARGTSILYVTHRLDEVRRLCKRCLILRNGKKVLDASTEGMSEEEVFRQMAGRSVVENYPVRESTVNNSAPAALRACHLSSSRINDVSFAVQPGEVVGVAALEGQGQSNLFRALVGLALLKHGHIEIDGKQIAIRSPRSARRAGMILVPEERKSEGLFNDLSTSANISILVINRAATFDFIQGKKERDLVEPTAALVDLSRRYLQPNVETLSGGNQQKAILARSLLVEPKCLLLFDPTRGVDVGTKQQIYRVIRAFAREGGAALFYSTELDELVHLCDRCLVIYRGTIAAELRGEGLTPELLLAIAAGHRTGTDRELTSENSSNAASL
jgi:ribose transport system ATP-binding protein